MYPAGSEAKMADVEFSHGMGAYGRDPEAEAFDVPPQNPLTVMTNIAGALVSLALMAGIAVWGYKLMVRDVSGIPIVRAAAGEMRVRPENPGGQLAQHQGLAVNVITANGEAAGPVDRVVLAPRAIGLTQEDQPIAASRPEPVIQPAPLGPAEEMFEGGAKFVQAAQPSAAAEEVPEESSGDPTIDALVAELTGRSTSMASDAEAGVAETEEELLLAEAPSDTSATIVPIDAPGLQTSMRPRIRPAGGAVLQRASLEVTAPDAAAQMPRSAEIDPAAIPSGTRLVQLGAFESVEIARNEWTRLERRFGDYLQGKSRVIEPAETGGRAFYRLRAMGFVDVADARRFCSAFKAEGVDCIPVASK
jgi:hypothetical protein